MTFQLKQRFILSAHSSALSTGEDQSAIGSFQLITFSIAQRAVIMQNFVTDKVPADVFRDRSDGFGLDWDNDMYRFSPDLCQM